MNEFDLIRTFFQSSDKMEHIPLGVGDDCALVQIQSGYRLAVSTDLLVSGQHFFENVDPFLLGHKVCAVNLSDLAAMGATPLGLLLSIALPKNYASAQWVQEFSKGIFSCLDTYSCPLIGGDTCGSSLLVFNATVLGQVPEDVVLSRSSAKVGDIIWVSGTLGGAGYSLEALFKQRAGKVYDHQGLDILRHRLEKPTPRLELGQAIQYLACSAIDISDGLFQDLGHILEQSKVGANLYLKNTPYEPYFNQCASEVFHLPDCFDIEDISDQGVRAIYSACTGEDYELCFTAPESHTEQIQALSNQLNLPLTPIGQIIEGSGLVLCDDSSCIRVSQKGLGFNHF